MICRASLQLAALAPIMELAAVDIDPQTAQRHVTRWVVSEVGNMLMGGVPQLVVSEQQTV
jgi:hypothetical protein